MVAFKHLMKNGKTHCANGPAIIDEMGNERWYLFDWAHRYYGSRQSLKDDWTIHGKLIKYKYLAGRN